MTQEQYVEHVAHLIGFHTPSAEVRERIEALYRERRHPMASADDMRRYLQVRTAREP